MHINIQEFLATAAQCRDHKLELLSASKKLLEESVVTSPDVAEENDEEMLQNKLSEVSVSFKVIFYSLFFV